MADQADQSEQADLVERAVDRLVPEADPTHSGSSATTAGILVWAYLAGRELEVWLADALGATGLTTSEFGALAGVAFAGEHTLTAGDLARWTVQTSGGTTKTIQRLVDRGLVHRVADTVDRRRTLLSLTDDGRRLVTRVAPESESIYGRIEERFGAERLDSLLADLRELEDALAEIDGGGR